ncbi:hypothetical protein DL96DRAFT_1810269 [Flagelloscypha sp. PMI_526]|nr:hypothetical protein DL96DRAFT_1810269 [Flagelloscypha sp. PMI_526]
MESPLAAATSLWRLMKLPEHVLANLQLSSIAQADLAVNSSFKLGHAAQTSIGLSSLSAVYLESLRGMSPVRKVTVNPRNACIAFHGVAYYTVNGQIPEDKSWDSIAGLYSTSGGGHIRIHTNFPHHRRGICDLLNLDPGPETTQRASQSHMCAFSKRTYEEWQMHPQAQALEDTPPVEIIKLRDDPPATQLSNVSKASDPLADVRILDLSRIIAAPVAGRTLAEYGAEVLLVTSPKLPDLPFLDIETSRYKRATQLDLTLENERS